MENRGVHRNQEMPLNQEYMVHTFGGRENSGNALNQISQNTNPIYYSSLQGYNYSHNRNNLKYGNLNEQTQWNPTSITK